MESFKTGLTFASGGDPSLLVWSPHASFLKNVGPRSCYAFPVLQRRGGLLLAIPDGFLSEELLLDGSADGFDGAVGPSKVFEATLLEEDESGTLAPTEFVKSFLVVDLKDECLSDMQVFGDEVDPDHVFPFEESMPTAFPKVADVVAKVLEWCDAAVTGRAHFYSAREEQERTPPPKRATPKKVTNAVLVDQIAALSAQVKLLNDQHQQMMQEKSSSSADRVPDPVLGGSMAARLPSLAASLGISQTPAKASQLMGPPPRVRQTERPDPVQAVRLDEPRLLEEEVAVGDPMLQAISNQSTALTALVAHLTGGTDALHDLSGGGTSQLSMSGRGVARREKMQQELAARSSGFFLAVQQQLYKRMNPSRQVPRTQAEVTASGASMTAYLERYGGYRHARDAGLALWVAAHAMDCAAADDFVGTKEFLALLVAALEQSALDGSWNLAWVLTLMDDPPAMLFADRMTPVVSHGRPFSPLIPPSWAATSLAYLKEIELLVTRKGEVKPTRTPKPTPTEPDEENSPSPKRRPKFPKKPKADPPSKEAK